MQRLLDNITQLHDQLSAYQGMLLPGHQRRVYMAVFGSGNAKHLGKKVLKKFSTNFQILQSSFCPHIEHFVKTFEY